jgi:hypothetical protein
MMLHGAELSTHSWLGAHPMLALGPLFVPRGHTPCDTSSTPPVQCDSSWVLRLVWEDSPGSPGDALSIPAHTGAIWWLQGASTRSGCWSDNTLAVTAVRGMQGKVSTVTNHKQLLHSNSTGNCTPLPSHTCQLAQLAHRLLLPLAM